MVVVESSRRWEGCERKSRPTSEVFRRGLIGMMNEGLEWARLPRVAAWWPQGCTTCTALLRCVCHWRKWMCFPDG
jgi:hypothetical protein